MKARRIAILLLLPFGGAALRAGDIVAAKEMPKMRLVFLPAERPTIASPEYSTGAFSAALLAETNRMRAAHGRRALRPLPVLDAAADDQSAFMAFTLSARHDGPVPGQGNVLERLAARLVSPAAAGENVLSTGFAPPAAASCAELAAKLVALWMDSPGHRANLLNRKFTHCGGAMRRAHFIGGAECVYGAQVFAAF